MKAALLKLVASLMSNGENRKKVFVAVLSIAAGFIGLMCLPVAVLASMGNVEPPDIDKGKFTDSAFFASLDDLPKEEIDGMESAGQSIEEAMTELGIRSQIIKAQLIYLTYFEELNITDFDGYAHLFLYAPNDEVLLDSIKANYGVEIPYEDFMRTYTMVMNATINQYMFTDEGNKNCADLASWAENVYIAGWGYEAGAYGEMNQDLRYRTADNAGLILGYLNYDPKEKVFASDYDILTYTEQGDITTMLEVAGIGLFDGTQHGIYIGGGEVIFSSADGGFVTKELISEGDWLSWCTYEGIAYPQEVQDKIGELNKTDEDSSSSDQ